MTHSPIQVCAQALENTTHCLGPTLILFLAYIVLVLSRLKGVSASPVAGRGECQTYISSYSSAGGGFFFVDRWISADSFGLSSTSVSAAKIVSTTVDRVVFRSSASSPNGWGGGGEGVRGGALLSPDPKREEKNLVLGLSFFTTETCVVFFASIL